MKTTKADRTRLGDITVRSVRDWLASIPEEYLDGTFSGLHDFTLKRVVAFRDKETGKVGVVVNGMGSHLPFDDTLIWEHVLE